MGNNAQTSPSDALIRVAQGLEKLAKTIEDAEVAQQKVASATMTLNDYGSLGEQRPSSSDPLTDYLIGKQ